jgi:hypothetical protein
LTGIVGQNGLSRHAALAELFQKAMTALQYGLNEFPVVIARDNFHGGQLRLIVAFGGTHKKNEGPIIYASFTGEPKRVLKFSWMNQDQSIKSFERCNHTFLYVSGLNQTILRFTESNFR